MAAGKNKFGVFEDPAGGFRAIPVGFNWAAALIPWIWAVAKGHWGPALALVGLDLILAGSSNTPNLCFPSAMTGYFLPPRSDDSLSLALATSSAVGAGLDTIGLVVAEAA